MARKYTQFDHYTLVKRDGRYHFYYYVNGKRVRKSTGKSKKSEAEAVIAEFFASAETSDRSLLEYMNPFYIFDTCPHIRRLLDEGKSIGETHVTKCRRWLDMYVVGDPIVDKRISEINRADLLDFRARLLKRFGDRRNTCNKVMSALKTVFKEAYFRQDMPHDPTQGIGKIKEERSEPGTFTKDELRHLFPVGCLGPWSDRYDYTCFLLAATAGMRKSEVLALRWVEISFESSVIRVERAWKTNSTVVTAKME